MDKQLFKQAMIKYFGGVILLGCLIFLPAGTLRFWRGWLLMAALFIPMFCAGIVMMLRCPDLLRKRLQVNEGEKEQRQVIAYSGLMFLCAFILADEKLDPKKNDVRGKEAILSTDDSPNAILMIPTNEELMIALDTARLVREAEAAEKK